MIFCCCFLLLITHSFVSVLHDGLLACNWFNDAFLLFCVQCVSRLIASQTCAVRIKYIFYRHSTCELLLNIALRTAAEYDFVCCLFIWCGWFCCRFFFDFVFHYVVFINGTIALTIDPGECEFYLLYIFLQLCPILTDVWCVVFANTKSFR